jgi:hypothetical protein
MLYTYKVCLHYSMVVPRLAYPILFLFISSEILIFLAILHSENISVYALP